MKYALFIAIMMYGLVCNAGICKHVSGNGETDNRSIFRIQQDVCGYMWFLTYNGINRYDGTSLKHYDLQADNDSIDFYSVNSELFTDSKKELWVLTRDGYLLSYNRICDRFEGYSDFRKHMEGTFMFLTLDSLDNFWFCSKNELYVCYLPTKAVRRIQHTLGDITGILPVGNSQYYLSSDRGVFSFSLLDESITNISQELSGGHCKQIYNLFYSPKWHNLVIVDRSQGINIFDCDNGELLCSHKSWKDLRVNNLKLLGEDNLLIATDGVGVFQMNMENYQITPFLDTDIGKEMGIRSNRIADLYVDEYQRLWVADFPDGITMYTPPGQERYKWFRHIEGNNQSLLNDRVNAVLRDSEGHIWFATDKGVCCYSPETHQWQELTSNLPCKLYTSLCELPSGDICVANYMHGLFLIRKDEMKIGDKFADAISANVVFPKDDTYVWIGTDCGLYLLNGKTQEWKRIKLPVSSQPFIRSLYQDEYGKLYVGTGGKGLLIINQEEDQTEIYASEYIRDISLIVPDGDCMLIGTGKELYNFNPANKEFHLLLGGIDNLTSGSSLRDGILMLGTSMGAFQFDKQVSFSLNGIHPYLYLDNFSISHQLITTTTKNTPLNHALNYTKVLNLGYDQNTFSFTAATINYDASELILYSWKLNNRKWTPPTRKNLISFSNLTPGEHLVSVRAVSAQNGNPISQRNMRVIIHPPLWQTRGAFLCYGILIVLLGFLFVYVWLVWRQRNLSRETVKVFVSAARDVCMPLTLIKNPLENLCRQYSSDTLKNILQQIKGIDSMFTNLVTVGRITSHPRRLSLLETELNTYLGETIESISSSVKQKKIKLHWEGTPGFAHVWIDKEKMTAILQGLLEMIVDCMNEGESIEIVTEYTLRNWKIKLEFTDNDCVKKKCYITKKGRKLTHLA